jgi:outer membrane protein OmpA-like peptidoglycan-associated protein
MDYYLLNDLNNEINNLRSQNDELSERPKYCPECPDNNKDCEKEPLYKTVLFKLNSSIVDKNQLISIYEAYEYAIDNNLPIKISAYADRETGNSEYNLKLSEKRAKSVAKVLNEKYRFPIDKIQMEWFGDEIQPYFENDWNRLVIIIVE